MTGYPKTEQGLLDRLVEAARTAHAMTPAQRRAQRISFIYGQMNGKLSKERIAEILDGGAE